MFTHRLTLPDLLRSRARLHPESIAVSGGTRTSLSGSSLITARSWGHTFSRLVGGRRLHRYLHGPFR